MSPAFKAWLIGAVNAVISGAATALGTAVAGTTLKQSAIAAGIAVVVSFLKWFVQHPIPGGTN